jgi:hypothetical protein
MKNMKEVAIILSFLGMCICSGQSSNLIENEEIQRFRQAYKECWVFSGYVTKEMAAKRNAELRQFAAKFEGFEVIDNHLECAACFSRQCEFSHKQCFDYAFQTILLEKRPPNIRLDTIKTVDNLNFRDFIRLEETLNHEEAEFVMYEGGHYGIYRGNGIVESKWGWTRAVFRHKEWQVPESYGKARYYKVIIK